MEEVGLQSWYSSESAKRRLGRLCQDVHEAGAAVYVGGSPSEPLLVLEAEQRRPPSSQDVVLSIDEAKAEWSAVTTACSVYGTTFRIRGRRIMRAVLTRHPENRHPAERFLRSSSGQAEQIASELLRLSDKVRKLRLGGSHHD
jgi:hypothetical protein